MDIEVSPAESVGSQRQSAEPGAHGAFRRRLLGIGLGGAAAALVPAVLGRASASTPPNTGAPTGTADGTADTAGASTGGSAAPSTNAATSTTAPPKRPVEADLPLLNFAQAAELAANELYKLALAGTLDDDQRTVLEVIGQSHLAYGQALSGLLGRIADNAPDADIVTSGTSDFSGDAATVLKAAYALESTLVATHTAIVGKILGTDAAYLLASIVTIEARNGTVLASLGGATELADLLVDNEADALTPAKG
ncbi:MAG: ferritin-like domain-containing protein [Ilumatobacteraceae bacterium]